jgi:hydroxymethylpyrimidine pyrophosphatase-like HAD family hydrolase
MTATTNAVSDVPLKINNLGLIMGKPFDKELEKINSTLSWGLEQDVNNLRAEILLKKDKPLYIVGSGGSLSACHYAAVLYQQLGLMAKAITPLDLYYSRNALRTANVLFISSSGKNNDILFGYKLALNYEPAWLLSMCMKKHTPLAKLSNDNGSSRHVEFDLPAGKDGFLATNSLVAFFAVLYNAFRTENDGVKTNTIETDDFFVELDNFIHQVGPDYTYTVLYAGWGQPVAIDLESKLAEAALGNVLLSDIRNFGHGRHHWFDKRKDKSAIIVLVTPEEEKITAKTLSLLPQDIPVLRIHSSFSNGFAAIDLLIKSFHLVSRIGILQKIDPGKPGVPDFGSKLYHLTYSSFYKLPEQDLLHTAIKRKTNVSAITQLNAGEQNYWKKAYRKFKENIEATVYGAIVFDYDGTLCSAENRKIGLDNPTANQLNDLLQNGIIIGIATGRGKSVRANLQEVIDPRFWKQVIVGYYNCADIGLLSQNELPDLTKTANASIAKIYEVISNYDFPAKIKPELKPSQLVIEMDNKLDWPKVRPMIIQLVISMGLPCIQILESSHSIDIIDHAETSKLSIIEHCSRQAALKCAPLNVLCIGDKGKWPGNDYQLLSHEFSLSVDEVSGLKDTCWNLSKPGVSNLKATQYYLSAIIVGQDSFKIKL